MSEQQKTDQGNKSAQANNARNRSGQGGQVNGIVMPDDQPCRATDPKELERQIMDASVPKNEREWWAKHRIEELQDFCIWMTCCGYEFAKHKYFCEQRDKLLKA